VPKLRTKVVPAITQVDREETVLDVMSMPPPTDHENALIDAYAEGLAHGLATTKDGIWIDPIPKKPVASVRHLQLAPESDDDMLTPAEVTAWFKVGEDWVQNHSTRTEPILPFSVLGGGRYKTRRYQRGHLRAWLVKHRNEVARAIDAEVAEKAKKRPPEGGRGNAA
jgi:hypothetical protein